MANTLSKSDCSSFLGDFAVIKPSGSNFSSSKRSRIGRYAACLVKAVVAEPILRPSYCFKRGLVSKPTVYPLIEYSSVRPGSAL
jgi:hypothetical protein